MNKDEVQRKGCYRRVDREMANRQATKGLTAASIMSIMLIIMIKKTTQTISAVEARKGLGMLLNRVSLRHETFVIERSGRKIAILKEYESNPGEHAGLATDDGGKLDLRDLAGIGADIWRAINVEDYIHRERSTWR